MKIDCDFSAIYINLSLTPTERLLQHQAALETVMELQKAHKKLYAKPKSTLKNSSRSSN